MTLYRRIFAMVACAVALVLLVTSVRSIMRVKPVMADLTTLPVIVIDPGHPGSIKTHSHLHVNTLKLYLYYMKNA